MSCLPATVQTHKVFFPEFHCNRFTPLPCSGLPSGALLRSRQRLGIFTTSALGWTGSHSAAPSATWLGTSVMVVRGRERHFGMDDEDGSELRAALASSPLVRVGVGGIRQILSPDSFCLGRVVADMASRGSHAVLAPQIILPHGLSWSEVRRVLGVQLWSPQDKLVPSHSIPRLSCGQGLRLKPGVLARQTKLHSHSAGGRDCEALPPSAGGFAQLRPSLQYRAEAEQLEPSQQARPGSSAHLG